MNTDLQIIFFSVLLLLLLLLLLLQLPKKNRADMEAVKSLLSRNNQEQTKNITEQIAAGANEQFKRFGMIQESVQSTLAGSRAEMDQRLAQLQSQLDQRLVLMQKQMDEKLLSIQQSGMENHEKVNRTLEHRIALLQDSNEKRLLQMQGVVDEKLQKTLETRLSQSFEMVSRQLESVALGLGEMKNLAADAKSLKNALINVKERGTYGEVRLEKLLSDILAPSQYESNVEISNHKRVEFAVKLPGNGEAPLLLPIDSKFPIEDYNRLMDAEDKQSMEEARKSLMQKIRVFAKDIQDKYIVPPLTTDFALMFLPTEGLYAEVVQNAAFFEELRDKYKVTAVGASTLSAFLMSLQMGFKTLAIEQRSQEVWNILRAVKAEFQKYGDLLEKAHKQIQAADHTLEDVVGRRTKAISRKLRDVEEWNESDASPLLEALRLDGEE